MRHRIWLTGLLAVCFIAFPCLLNRAVYVNAADDTTPPVVRATIPAADAVDAAVGANIDISFDEVVRLPAYTGSAFTLRTAAGTNVAATISLSTDGLGITIDPTSNLVYSTAYTLVLNNTITDLAGNPLAPFTLNFTTVPDTFPPTITYFYPADGATGVPLGARITINFSEPLNTSTVTPDTITVQASDTRVPCRVSLSNSGTGATITLTPDEELMGSTTYTVAVPAGQITDTAGNALGTALTWSFTTETLSVSNQYPSAGSSGFPIDNAIHFDFNQRVMKNTVTSGNVYLQPYDDTSKISAAVSYSTSTRRVTLKPSKPLEYDTRYRVLVTNGITDINGTAFAGVSWYFETEDQSNSALIIDKKPAADQKGVATDQVISFRFSAPMDEDTIDDDTVYLRRSGSSSDVDADVVYDENTRTVTLIPEDGLRLNTEYTVYVSSRIENSSGRRINSARWSFTTGDFETSRIEDRSPSPNEDDVELDSRVIIEFAEGMDSSSIKTSSIYLRRAGYNSNIKCDISYNDADRTVILAPLTDLFPATTYTVYLTSKVKDAAGNSLSASNWSFITQEADFRLVYRYPERNSYQVPVNTQIRAGFTMPLTPSTVNAVNCTLKRTGGIAGLTIVNIPVKVAYDSARQQIVMTPSAPLDSNTEYTVTIRNRVKDYTGNFINEISWNFVTGGDSALRGTAASPLIKLGDNYLLVSGTQPYIKDGRTMVPYRAILEALGATVGWDAGQQRVTAALNSNNIQLYIGNKTAYRNDQTVALDVAPELRNSQTIVPLRFISEALGKRVAWDEENWTVNIQ